MKFDLKAVIDYFGLSQEFVAKVFFPHIKYPVQALARIIKGEGTLTVEQLEQLAEHINVDIKDLFSVASWKGTCENGLITYKKHNYKAILNWDRAYLTIFKDDGIIYQTFVYKAMSIEQFIDWLDEYIESYETPSENVTENTNN